MIRCDIVKGKPAPQVRDANVITSNSSYRLLLKTTQYLQSVDRYCFQLLISTEVTATLTFVDTVLSLAIIQILLVLK